MARFDWKSLVRKVAPALGTALGGPLAGAATAALAEGLLGRKGTEQEIAEVLSSASPDTLLKLRQADMEFQAKMKELDIDIFALEVEDRKSARSLYAVNYIPQIVISAVFFTGYFWTLYWVMSKVLADIPDWQKALATTIFGVLTAGVTTIMAFWFGSSFGSREKTRALAVSSPTLSEEKDK